MGLESPNKTSNKLDVWVVTFVIPLSSDEEAWWEIFLCIVQSNLSGWQLHWKTAKLEIKVWKYDGA